VSVRPKVGGGFDLRDLDAIPDPLAARPSRASAAMPAATPGPTRSTLRNRRALALFVGLAWLLVTPMLWGYRSDIPTEQIALHIALPTALGVAALVLAFSSGSAGVGPALKQALLLGIAAPIIFVVAALCTPCFESASEVAWSSFLCGDALLVLALLPLGLFAWAHRRTAVAGAGFRGAIAGGAIGLVAAGFQALHCVHSDGVHVALGHGWPIVVLGLLGGFLVSRVTRVA
jgi:hypothetical protein